jgi:ATP-dependent Clp protease ATP-binding subunit ClpB
LNTDIANLSVERDTLKARWNEEKEVVEKIQNAKAAVESLKLEAEKAEREGDYGKVAEIRYGKVKEQEKIIADYSGKLNEYADNKRLLKEEVDAEDIAESVAKATGIPVSKMLQSEGQNRTSR